METVHLVITLLCSMYVRSMPLRVIAGKPSSVMVLFRINPPSISQSINLAQPTKSRLLRRPVSCAVTSVMGKRTYPSGPSGAFCLAPAPPATLLPHSTRSTAGTHSTHSTARSTHSSANRPQEGTADTTHGLLLPGPACQTSGRRQWPRWGARGPWHRARGTF
ncbi:hypothetical protein B0J13DRAFT_8061 [Dactylonectria estremocensis]|uniref:Secreted protein n=1 Tax=Dactylonectria estremocensis TaxID=1079267 RepID=A0A9P9JI71_9HYPO|nr:hypothetical protein B0J13DRAFT_8061 [Dactylonectria estremocensis]